MAAREAFWNIGHVWIFYALAAIAVALFAAGCWRNIRIWRKGWVAKGALVQPESLGGSAASMWL